MWMLRPLLVLLCVLLPASAWADRLPKPVEHPVDPLPIRLAESGVALDVLFEPADEAVAAGAADGGEVDALGGDSESGGTAGTSAESSAPEGVTREGPGPWPLIGAPVDDGECRAPRASADGYHVLAICRGTDPAAPGDDHVVLRRGDAILRYPVPLARVDDLEVDLSADGMRFAGAFQAGSGRALHLVDLSTRRVQIVGGGWRDPGSPSLADGSAALGFVATVGGKPTAVLVRLGETREEDVALRLWKGGEPLAVRGISADGRRLLITTKAIDLEEAILLEGEKGVRFDLSGRKGDVSHAALHPSGEQAVFSSRVGGACAVFWVDLSLRKRKDFLGSVEHCYGRVGLDDSRRYVAHEGVRGQGRRGFVWDRKKDEARLILPTGCADPRLTDDGAFVASTCDSKTPGRGTWLFRVPDEESKR